MKYYRYTNQAGKVAYGSGPTVPPGATEITADEYNQVMQRARTGQNV